MMGSWRSVGTGASWAGWVISDRIDSFGVVGKTGSSWLAACVAGPLRSWVLTFGAVRTLETLEYSEFFILFQCSASILLYIFTCVKLYSDRNK